MPEWRNWQTRTTQTRVSLALVGSIPTSGTVFLRFSIPESRRKSIGKPGRWLAIEDGVIITFFIVMC